jgi:hypothetical protein
MLKWLKEKKFYSICSMHRVHKDDCELCRTGHWEYERLLQIGHFFHRYCYPLWFWYVNKKWRRK